MDGSNLNCLKNKHIVASKRFFALKISGFSGFRDSDGPLLGPVVHSQDWHDRSETVGMLDYP